MNRHMLTHTCHEGKFKYGFCEYGGQNEWMYTILEGITLTNFVCCLCYFEARSEYILEMHMATYESFKCKYIFVDKDVRSKETYHIVTHKSKYHCYLRGNQRPKRITFLYTKAWSMNFLCANKTERQKQSMHGVHNYSQK
jgi:hypothetical protein